MPSTGLTRSTVTPTSRKIFTFSAWIKKTDTDISDNQALFSVTNADGQYFMDIRFHHANEQLEIIDYQTATQMFLRTNRVFRDPSAFYHIVVTVDTTNATADDRIKMYVNGVQETSFASRTNPSLNHDTNVNGTNTRVGFQDSQYYFDGSMAHVHFIDGTAYDADTFGETDATTGIWKPKTAPSVTYGTNGFFLKFENSGSMGTDSSGNANNFTVNGTMTQTIDTPSNVFATLNPLGNYYPASTFSEGNLKVTFNASNYSFNNSTIGVSSGKWYFETKIITTAINNQNLIGISDRDSIGTTDELGSGAYQYGFYGGNSGGDFPGRIRNNNSYNSYSDGTTYTAGDIIGTYVDLDNNKIYFAKNGTILNSGTGFTITSPANTDTGFYFLSVGSYSGSNSPVYEVNFGNPTFSISSGNSDPNGYGNFEYDPSAGTFDGGSKSFYALNTKNLAEFG